MASMMGSPIVSWESAFRWKEKQKFQSDFELQSASLSCRHWANPLSLFVLIFLHGLIFHDISEGTRKNTHPPHFVEILCAFLFWIRLNFPFFELVKNSRASFLLRLFLNLSIVETGKKVAFLNSAPFPLKIEISKTWKDEIYGNSEKNFFPPDELQVLRTDKTLDKPVTLPEHSVKMLTNLSRWRFGLKRPILLE